MRNRISHAYRSVDAKVVWTVLAISIPELVAELDLHQGRD